MKKTYITPAMEQVVIEPSNMLATSAKVGINTTDEVDASSSLSQNRRGNWGDLWEE